uniref:Zinc finger protein 14-like n=1 Tax=Saccoglossus kowalevskii TaxID=10224 RepID=A0ABM0LXB1_SACKO|nr:PREDICTED: zinc finger protein 14-like [Saccoglossus kowalevskii]
MEEVFCVEDEVKKASSMSKHLWRKEDLQPDLHAAEKSAQCYNRDMAQGTVVTSRLQRHCQRLHTSVQPCECEQCDKSFLGLAKHTPHACAKANEIVYQCTHCSQSFTIECRLKNHVCVHVASDHCKFTPTVQSTSQHEIFSDDLQNNFPMETLVSTEDDHGMKTLQYEIPGKSVLREFHCEAPMEESHSNVTGNMEEGQSSLEKSLQCKNKFLRESQYDIHANTVPPAVFYEKHPEQKHSRTREKVLQCGQCGKRFASQNQLKVHMRIHTGEKPFQCEVCKKCFAYSNVLKIHMGTHSRIRPHQCGMCGKSYVVPSQLKTHMKSHMREKQYQCRQCKKLFPLLSQLNLHKKTHTKESVFHCKQCQKSFSQRRRLEAHMKVHNDEKPYQCDHCEKRYAQQTQLKVHMRTHTGEKPFQCEICRKSFAYSHVWKIHMGTHTQERPHQCVLCGKSYVLPSQLRAHIKTHTGEKPHQCRQCGKRFLLPSQLNTHMKMHEKSLFQCAQCHESFTSQNRLEGHAKMHLENPIEILSTCMVTEEAPLNETLHGTDFIVNRSLGCFLRKHV